MSIMHRAEGGLEVPDLERRIVDHVERTRFEDLPPATVEAARRTLMWFLATALSGSSAPGSSAIARFALDQGGREDATVVGMGQGAPAPLAGFVNACFAKAHEYEDKYWLDETGGFAIGFAVVAAVLAAAEVEGAVGGREVLTAIAVAVDLQARLLSAVREELSPVHTGWNSTYVFSNYGAGIGAAKAMGLPRARLLDTLGLVHAQAAGNFQGQMEGVLGIRLQAGFVVRNGLTAAALARGGITGAQQFLSGRFGLYKLHYPAHPVDMDSIADSLGERWLGDRLGYKGYPCGVVAHPVLDAVRQLREAMPVERIRAIRVLGTPTLGIMAEPVERRKNPANGIDAQFSLPWVVACVLRDGMLKLQHFDDALVRDPRYLEIAHKVAIDMGERKGGVTVEIELDDGTALVSEPVEFCRGHPDNPVTLDEMADVLRESAPLTAVPFSADAADQLIRGVRALEDMADIRDLLRPTLRDGEAAA